jgi:putative transposase
MKRSRHSAAQVVSKLRDADGMLAAGQTIGEACRALGISEAAFQRWRHQYGGMKAEEAKRLKELEEENKRLKKLLAEANLDKTILKEALEGNCSVLRLDRRRSFACGGALGSANDGRAGC